MARRTLLERWIDELTGAVLDSVAEAFHDFLAYSEPPPPPRASRQKRPPRPRRFVEVDPPNPYALLGVTARAPREVVEAAYRALAMKHHPDRGGDGARMRIINEAMDAVRTARGWKK